MIANQMHRIDVRGKMRVRMAYRMLTSTRARIFGRRSRKGERPLVFYGGAIGGNVGGPFVKVRRLRKAFPQTRGFFNLIYSLSAAPYLSRTALRDLSDRGVVIVHNQNGVFHSGWYGGDWTRENSYMVHAYQRANYVFWQSTFCRVVADQYLGKRLGPGEILFNAVDTKHFIPSLRKKGGATHPFTFLLTGKLRAHHAYRLMDSIAGVAAVRTLGLDANLVVAGTLDAGAHAALDATVRRYGMAAQVRFIGPYTQAEAPKVYGAADAYIMTKHADPCPNVVIEAMACGLPVVFVANGGVPELVGASAGVGIPAGDDIEWLFRPEPEELANAMLVVAENRGPMAQAARRRAEALFDLRPWIGRHEVIFNHLLLDASG